MGDCTCAVAGLKIVIRGASCMPTKVVALGFEIEHDYWSSSQRWSSKLTHESHEELVTASCCYIGYRLRNRIWLEVVRSDCSRDLKEDPLAQRKASRRELCRSDACVYR